jgi:hypothetical protein
MPLVPTPIPVATLASYFANAANDATGGNPALLLSPFEHDLINPNNNTSTNDIKAGLFQSGEACQMIAVAITSNNNARLYMNVFRWTDSLINRVPDLAGKILALEGELVGNQGATTELPETLFHLPNSTVVVVTVATILTALAGDAALERMAPVNAGDPDTEGVKTRKLVPVPFFLCGPWLALGEEGITPRQFFTTIYPMIVAEGKVAECKALIQYFQVAITTPNDNAQVSAIDVVRPTPPARHIQLLQRQQHILKQAFPQLRQDAVMAGSNIIGQGLGVLAQQHQDHIDEQRRDKEEAKADPVRKYWGRVAFDALLRNTQQPDEASLVRDNPVYLALAQAGKNEKESVVQSHIQKTLTDLKEPYLSLIFTPANMTALKNNEMGRTNKDSLTSGLVGNSFLWGGTKVEQQQALNKMAALHRAGGTAISEKVVEQILQVKVGLPLPDKALLNIQRQMVVCKVLLPPHHTFRIYIEKHFKAMTNFKSEWDDTVTPNPSHNLGKGVLQLQYLNLRADQFWLMQGQSDTAVQMPSPTELIEQVNYQADWEPKLSPTLRKALNWDAFCRTGKGRVESNLYGLGDTTIVSGATAPLTPGSSYTRTRGGDDMSTLSGSATAFQQFLLAVQQGMNGGQNVPPGHTPPGEINLPGAFSDADRRKVVKNDDYSRALFGDIVTRKDAGGKTITSKSVRDKVEANTLPALPKSKMDPSLPMCLAWHSKGMCNPKTCPSAKDHVQYTDAEYQNPDETKGLKTWCDSHYPKSA